MGGAPNSCLINWILTLARPVGFDFLYCSQFLPWFLYPPLVFSFLFLFFLLSDWYLHISSFTFLNSAQLPSTVLVGCSLMEWITQHLVPVPFCLRRAIPSPLPNFLSYIDFCICSPLIKNIFVKIINGSKYYFKNVITYKLILQNHNLPFMTSLNLGK